jgi:hypothetical protein
MISLWMVDALPVTRRTRCNVLSARRLPASQYAFSKIVKILKNFLNELFTPSHWAVNSSE